MIKVRLRIELPGWLDRTFRERDVTPALGFTLLVGVLILVGITTFQ